MNSEQKLSFIKDTISTYCHIDSSRLHHNMQFGTDIIVNSIDMGEAIMIIKKQFPHIDQKKIFSLKTFGDLIQLCESST